MGTPKGPTEGGSGGKRGHSNMEHWAESAEIKDATRTRRRLDSQAEIDEQLKELDQPPPHGPDGAQECSHG
ncbi:MAG: hypothetical protein K8E66_12465 [Phycisphaerales bacterium]|nr:hypothetical protein [Phycisphaerales bacterium]